MVLSVFALDKLHIDDPVGAVSVHCVIGVWGTLAKTELKGLDLTEHGQDAYASFQFFSNT